jgi:hypothetical protein
MKYYRLKTTTREVIEIGSYIKQEGTPHFGSPMIPIQGVVMKMADCDSGIFIFVKTDSGNIEKIHALYDIPYGLRMHQCGRTITILKSPQKQFSFQE